MQRLRTILDYGQTQGRCVALSTFNYSFVEHSQNVVLFIISGASMIAGLASNIQNRERCLQRCPYRHWLNTREPAANAQMQQQLHTSSGNISLSLSLYILLQGNVPFIWSAISEIKGRKVDSLLS